MPELMFAGKGTECLSQPNGCYDRSRRVPIWVCLGRHARWSEETEISADCCRCFPVTSPATQIQRVPSTQCKQEAASY